MTFGVYNGTLHNDIPSGSSYVGPLDIVPGAVVAYSAARALSAAWIGQNVVKLRRDSDDATMIFVAGIDGGVDAGAITTWLAGANGFVDTLYDQSGDAHDLLASSSGQPAWISIGIGSVPALSFTINNRLITAGNVDLSSNAYTVLMVFTAETFSGSGSLLTAGDTNNAPDWFVYLPSPGPDRALVMEADDANYNNGNGVGTHNNVITIGSAFLLDGAWNTVTGDININGSVQPVDSMNYGSGDAGTLQVPFRIGDQTPSHAVPGLRSEIIVYGSVESNSNRINLSQNIAAYYGITLL